MIRLRPGLTRIFFIFMCVGTVAWASAMHSSSLHRFHLRAWLRINLKMSLMPLCVCVCIFVLFYCFVWCFSKDHFCSGCHLATYNDNRKFDVDLATCSFWSIAFIAFPLFSVGFVFTILSLHMCFARNCQKWTENLHRNCRSWRRLDRRRKRLQLKLRLCIS